MYDGTTHYEGGIFTLKSNLNGVLQSTVSAAASTHEVVTSGPSDWITKDLCKKVL